MENTSDFSQQFEYLRYKLRTQTAAVEELGLVLAQYAKTLIQYDQANRLSSLKVRVMHEAEQLQMMESAAGAGYSKDKLINGLVTFAAGTIAAAAAGQRSPLSVGASLSSSVFDKRSPFGAVMIAIGKQGLPDDVQVVSVSRLARESNTSEMQVAQALRDNGCLLIEPDIFGKLLENIKRKILDGSIYLPVSIEGLAKELKSTLRWFPASPK